MTIAMLHSDEQVSISGLCTVLEVSRSQFYRKVKHMRDYRVREEARQTLRPFAGCLARKF
jgi:hypothetical protein